MSSKHTAGYTTPNLSMLNSSIDGSKFSTRPLIPAGPDPSPTRLANGATATHGQWPNGSLVPTCVPIDHNDQGHQPREQQQQRRNNAATRTPAQVRLFRRPLGYCPTPRCRRLYVTPSGADVVLHCRDRGCSSPPFTVAPTACGSRTRVCSRMCGGDGGDDADTSDGDVSQTGGDTYGLVTISQASGPRGVRSSPQHDLRLFGLRPGRHLREVAARSTGLPPDPMHAGPREPQPTEDPDS